MTEMKVKLTNNLGRSRFWLFKARLGMKLWNFRQKIPKSRKQEFRVVGDVGLIPA